MAPLIHALRDNSRYFDVHVCLTAQHRELLDHTLEVFGINADIDLDLMIPSQTLSGLTKDVINGMQEVLEKISPDIVLVHGDTTTAMASALTAFYNQITVGHVEAGLRTKNIWAPFPEEFNRQTISKIADFHFTPTKNSEENLLSEGVPQKKIFVTGNTVIDALHDVLHRIELEPNRKNNTIQKLHETVPFDWQHEKFVLITGHRRENFGLGFDQIFESLTELASNHHSVHFIYPVHPNPNLLKLVDQNTGRFPNLHFTDPIEYQLFCYLLKHCYCVLTDSGGIQEEAPSLGKPVLVMRENTERPEAVQAGTVKLVGTNSSTIKMEINKLLTDGNHYSMMSSAKNPYGDGTACKKIADVLISCSKTGHD